MKILTYPHSLLRRKTKEVEKITDAHRAAAEQMIEIVRMERALGLAANQLGIPYRMFVTNVGEVFINPHILERSGPNWVTEGCLSLPGEERKVLRYEEVFFSYSRIDGKLVGTQRNGLRAAVVQHEIDHLNGKLIID